MSTEYFEIWFTTVNYDKDSIKMVISNGDIGNHGLSEMFGKIEFFYYLYLGYLSYNCLISRNKMYITTK